MDRDTTPRQRFGHTDGGHPEPDIAAERHPDLRVGEFRAFAPVGVDDLARGHIRHYVGNRDELRDLFQERLINRYAHRAAQLAASGTPGLRAEAIVDYFFSEEMRPDDDNAAIDALLAAARYDDDLRARIHAVYAGVEALLKQALADDHPGQPPAIYEDAAYEILALAYGHWTLAEMGFPASRNHCIHQHAQAVVTRVANSPTPREPSSTGNCDS